MDLLKPEALADGELAPVVARKLRTLAALAPAGGHVALNFRAPPRDARALAQIIDRGLRPAPPAPPARSGCHWCLAVIWAAGLLTGLFVQLVLWLFRGLY